MGLTQSRLQHDRSKIFAKMAEAGATLTATVASLTSGETTTLSKGDTFTAWRTNNLSFRMIREAGWENVYQGSIRAVASDVADLPDRSTLMVDGEERRVLRIEPGATNTYAKLHLGDINEVTV